MTTQQPMQWIESLTSASFLWGPFFFSILFMLVITRTAHSYYSRVNERVSPPASSEERQDYRFYFRLSIVCGIVLVFLSVGWWIYAQLQQHTFQGVIVGLKQNQQIIPTDNELYLRSATRTVENDRAIVEYHFAIVRDSPFSKGQAFRLDFYPEIGSGSVGTKPEPVKLLIQYRGAANDKFTLERDGDSFKLVPIGS